MPNIICQVCGAVYEGNEIPSAMKCVCEGKEFKLLNV